MKRTMILGILLATLVLVVACAPKTPTQPTQPVPVAPYEPTPMPPTVAEDTTPEQDVVMVDQEVVVIDDVAEDLDLNDLENLDQQLAELENLEI
jgi:PBP1b-binding outer membrane lipoprotein LpoB